MEGAPTTSRWRPNPEWQDREEARWRFRVLVLIPPIVFGALVAADYGVLGRPLLWSGVKLAAFLCVRLRQVRKCAVLPYWWGSVWLAFRAAAKSRAAGGRPAQPAWTHLVVMPAYRDSAATIETSLKSLAAQTIADHIVCLVSFEERSPDVHGTIEYLRKSLAGSGLKGLHFAIHPHKLAGEIPGTASNFTWGCYEMMRHLGLEHLSDPDSPSHDPAFASRELDHYALTTGDCDCVFHPIYFETVDRMLEGSHCRPDNLFLQSSLFFYLNANTGNRVGNFMNRWFAGSMGASTVERNHAVVIPGRYAVYFPINNVTLTLRTGLQAGFNHPGVVPADMNLYHRVLLARKGRITFKMVPSLVFTEGATGKTIKEQAVALVTQWQRWFRGPYQETDYLVGATWKVFTDPIGWLLFWVQFLYFRVWYMWDLQMMLFGWLLPFGWVGDDELRSHYGWLGRWYTAEGSLPWLGPTIGLLDICFSLFLTEAIVMHIMGRAAKRNRIELNSAFGYLQTAVHLVLAVFTYVPAVVLLWVGLFEEFVGRARTFTETPKASMTYRGGSEPQRARQEDAPASRELPSDRSSAKMEAGAQAI